MDNCYKISHPKCRKRGFHVLGTPKWIGKDKFIRMCKICSYMLFGRIASVDGKDRVEMRSNYDEPSIISTQDDESTNQHETQIT